MARVSSVVSDGYVTAESVTVHEGGLKRLFLAVCWPLRGATEPVALPRDAGLRQTYSRLPWSVADLHRAAFGDRGARTSQ